MDDKVKLYLEKVDLNLIIELKSSDSSLNQTYLEEQEQENLTATFSELNIK